MAWNRMITKKYLLSLTAWRKNLEIKKKTVSLYKIGKDMSFFAACLNNVKWMSSVSNR